MTENTQAWKIRMTEKEFVVTVYAAKEEATVNALVDIGADPSCIAVQDGAERGTVDIHVIRGQEA